MQDDQYRETLRVVGSALHPQLIFYSVRDRLVFFSIIESIDWRVEWCNKRCTFTFVVFFYFHLIFQRSSFVTIRQLIEYVYLMIMINDVLRYDESVHHLVV
jgi:hypothetical protein